MNAIDLILHTYDDSWSHAWESVDSVLQGITDEEAAWQSPAYRDETPQSGLPLPGTILWHIAHVEHCARMYAGVLRTRPVDAYPDLPPPSPLTLSELVPAMEAARNELREAIASLKEDHLEETCIGQQSVAEFLGNILRHHTWHGGEIAVARRLYRANL